MSERPGTTAFWCVGIWTAACLSVKTLGATWWVLPHALFSWYYVAYWIVFWSGWVR